MSEAPSQKQPVLYVLVCAAPPAQSIREFVIRAQGKGWDVCVLVTPTGTRFVDRERLAQLTGHLVRYDYKLPGEADPLPKADALVVVPATFNTINKVAGGIADTLVTAILCEALGRGTPPLVVVPCLKMDLVRHPAFAKSIEMLRSCGVQILHEPELYPSPLIVSWDEILDTLYRTADKNIRASLIRRQ